MECRVLTNFNLIESKFQSIQGLLYSRGINISNKIEYNLKDITFITSINDILNDFHLLPIHFKYYIESFYNRNYIDSKLDYLTVAITTFNKFYNSTIVSEQILNYLNYIINLKCYSDNINIYYKHISNVMCVQIF